MEFQLVKEAGTEVIEGAPGTPLLSTSDDIARVIEACFEHGAQMALLYADNLPGRFFDLSSGEAGAVLQKLRNYGIRLAVVSSPTRRWSSRFGEMLGEEQRGRLFGVFDSREDAWAWLRT